ncbi:hypothetical protein QQF64_000354 [Cirrhinus molitorella]|uniref:Uncharacterized protein n=1 Tax=Cirrhinus molitorella TaxID=172907 RepID=A0ABR3NXP3_9TELE
MKVQVDVICCKSVGTDLSMLDIEDFITEICQLKKEVASLEAKLRERGDKLNREDVEEISVHVSDGTEAQDSIVRDQRSRDTQDSECSLNLLCHSDAEDHESTDQTFNCKAEEQEILLTPLKMCSVKLVDFRNLIESKAEETTAKEEPQSDEEDEDHNDADDQIEDEHEDQNDADDDDDFVPSDDSAGSSDGETGSTSKERRTMLRMKAQVDVICCKSVGTDLSMLDIEDFITEICQLKKEVASLEAKLRERGDKQYREDVEEVSVRVSDGTEAQDSVVRDQRSRDTQDSECSLNLLCYSDAEDHESTDQTSDCNAGEQEMKMCFVKLVDCRNLIESRGEDTIAEEEQSNEEEQDDDWIDDDKDDENDGNDGTEAQDSVWRVLEQRSKYTWLCHSDAQDLRTSDCNAGEQQMKMCSVKLVDCRNLIESRAEKQQQQTDDEEDDDDFVPSDDSVDSSSDGETASTSKERWTVTDCGKTFSKKGHLVRRGALTIFSPPVKPLKKQRRHEHSMLRMKAQVDVICCKSVGTDLSMLDIEDFITEICQLKKEVASLEAKLRERGDKQYREKVSVRVTDGTEAQDSVWSVRDQRSRDTQDSELSLTLLCYSDPEDHESNVQTFDCKAEEQEMLLTPLKMCSVKLVDCRNLIECKEEATAEEQQQQQQTNEDDENDDGSQNMDDEDQNDDDGDFVPSDDKAGSSSDGETAPTSKEQKTKSFSCITYLKSPTSS